MRRFLLTIMLLTVALLPVLLPSAAEADEDSESGLALKIGGSVRSDDRFLTTPKDGALAFQEYRLEMKLEARPMDKAYVYSETWLRYLGTGSTATTSADLFDQDKVSPVNLSFRQAYFQLNGFLLDNVDLKLGRQRIAWGRADRFNPTDNINAYDLEDMWDFGRHLGSDAVQASVYWKSWKLTGVFVPIFTPTVLPRGNWINALMPASSGLPPGLSVGNTATAVSLPNSTLNDGMTLAAKLDGKVLGFDFSLSYLWGRDTLPVVSGIALVPTAPGVVDVQSILTYPRQQVIGVDLAGSIGPVGVWAEGALFLPRKVTLKTDLSALGAGVVETTALDNKPYFKFVVGADYNFKYDVYLNVQYLHGFFNERGASNLEDYFVINLDWKFLGDKLKLTPVSAIVEIQDWNHFSDSWAFAIAPKLTYYPFDNAEIALSYYWLEGKDSTLFGKVRDSDQFRVFAKYTF